MRRATPPPTALPLVLAGSTLAREEVLDRCVEELVDGALTGGGFPFNPDPAWLGPRTNADDGFRFDAGDADPVRVYLSDGDLAEVIARAREEVEADLGFVPSGMHRTVDLTFADDTFSVEAIPAELGRWAVQASIAEELERLPDGRRSGMYRIIREDEFPDAEGRWDTPAEAVAAAVRWIAGAYDDAERYAIPV